jgi:hypothetical protein
MVALRVRQSWVKGERKVGQRWEKGDSKVRERWVKGETNPGKTLKKRGIIKNPCVAFLACRKGLLDVLSGCMLILPRTG